MIKSELVQRIAERVGQRSASPFSVTPRPARAGRNPRTGEHVPVDQKSVPFFKTGKEMRERLNRDVTEAGAAKVDAPKADA